ncbi:MAG: hypothetical protein IIT48_00795 [Lachnospiraceae bacterium]|nr:hypothetical protein [Lachnospiraceae bacterium]
MRKRSRFWFPDRENDSQAGKSLERTSFEGSFLAVLLKLVSSNGVVYVIRYDE